MNQSNVLCYHHCQQDTGDMAISSDARDTTKRGEDGGADDRALGGFAPDPHSKRILLDLAEWYARLARLAELREEPGER
jgi:hypothetical protein